MRLCSITPVIAAGIKIATPEPYLFIFRTDNCLEIPACAYFLIRNLETGMYLSEAYTD